MAGAEDRFGKGFGCAARESLSFYRDISLTIEYQLASYPIYFPLYIGEFEFAPEDSKKTRRVTIVMDAHDENVGSTANGST